MIYQLRHPYIAVSSGGGCSYGGNQMRSALKTEREVGCGVIAGLDLLIYLNRYHLQRSDYGLKVPAPAEGEIPESQYHRMVSALRKKFLPLIPKHGINGLLLAAGMNACFLVNRMPYTALWGVPYARLWDGIQTMLERDIPVILSIGPNFPLFWKHRKLKLYVRRADGAFVPGTQTHAHYVTITGMDDEWLRISSWGKMFFVRREEYLDYVKENSVRLVCNILYVRKKDRGE
ncbi:MAG: hypothetical protein IK149_01800 [Oscillospiraceae bacterium]|nr:hypothetical protein [Oscillospiraceae bacterium]